MKNEADFLIARVIAEYKGLYKVKNDKGEYLGKITGKQMFTSTSREDYPAVGDFVEVIVLNDEQAVIHRVLPRKTIIKRKYVNRNDSQVIATNIDTAFVVESVDRDFNLNRFERYFTLARDGGVEPAIILNKTDLISKEKLVLLLDQLGNRFNDIDIIPTSIKTDEGLDMLNDYILSGKTYCFLGSSGVGKSSLINKLLGTDAIETADIGFKTNRGKHVTTGREMYFLNNGGVVIDNPGMREIGLTDTCAGLDDLFVEITALAKKCKFTDCTHICESSCEVLMALNEGRLDAEKYANYVNLKKETEYYQMSNLEKREKDKQFGKFIKKAKKEIKRAEEGLG
jgi:ribosome biogenesis GTPase